MPVAEEARADRLTARNSESRLRTYSLYSSLHHIPCTPNCKVLRFWTVEVRAFFVLEERRNASFDPLVLFCFTYLRCPVCRAQDVQPDPDYYSFHPRSIMSLGVGFSPNDVSVPKLPCVQAQRGAFENGALSTSFSSVLVTNAEQLKSALGIDLKIDASFLGGSVGGQFNYSDSALFDEKSVTLVVQATTEFGRIALQAPITLTDSAKALLATPTKFANACGTRLVSVERRGASVSAIITIDSLSQGDKQSISAGLSASGGFGPVSGSASAAFKTEMARAAQSGRLNIQVVATGGTGLGGLGKLLVALTTNPDSLDKIQAGLGDYLSQFNADNSVPIGFHVLSMSDLGYDPADEDVWTINKERRLRQIAATYDEVSSIVDAGNGILGGSDIRSKMLSADTLSAIRKAVPQYQTYLDNLAAAHKGCKADQTADGSHCVPPENPVSPDPIPRLPSPPHSSFRVQADGISWDESRSRAIVYGGQGLTQGVRLFDPTVKKVGLTLLVEGPPLQTAILEFIDDSSVVSPVTVLPLKGSGTGSFAFMSNISTPISWCDGDCDFALFSKNGLAGLIHDYILKSSGEHSGGFAIKFTDFFGREFLVQITQGDKWKNSNGQIVIQGSSFAAL